MGLQPAGFGAVGGAGQPGVITMRAFPFAYDTAGIFTGAALYTPTVGDLLVQSFMLVSTAWDGTTPSGTVGLFTSSFGSLFEGSTLDMTQAEDATLGVASNAFINERLSGAFKLIATRFVTTDPLCVLVSQDGTPGNGAATVYGDTAPTVPLVVVTGVNDEFVFTGDGGAGTPETFTMAAGTHGTIAAVIAAMGAAKGSVSMEAFTTKAEPTNSSGTIQLTMVGDNGAGDNGNTITLGTHDVAASLGFTGNPDTFSGGTGGNPGSTQGAAVLYVVTATPL